MRRLACLLCLVLPLSAVAVRAQEEEEPEPGTLDVPTVATGTARLVVDGREGPLAMSETPLGPLFALAPIVRELGGELRVGPAGVGYQLRLPEQETLFGAGSRVAVLDGAVVDLPQPPKEGEGGVQVPIELLRRTLGSVLHYDFMWSEADRRLYALPQQRRQVQVDWNLVHMQGISTLVLQFPERPRYRVEEGGQRYRVELLGGEDAVPTHREPVSDPLVRGLSFQGQEIVVDVAADAVVEHYEQSRPFRLVFDVYRQVASGLGDVESAASAVPVIVIDPGHGGGETGAVGPSGVQEKELTLAIARLLERRLEDRLPVRVVLTRDEDADLHLDTRPAIANQNQAALFVSIHLNSAPGSSATGAETYFLSLEASDARAAAAARAENLGGSPPPGEPFDEARQDLELILWDLAQSRYLADSQLLAAMVQEELNVALGLRDRGVKQAPFRVLMGAAMPAVLVELGFINNPQEEARLLRPDYQMELVDALVRAISRFHARLAGEAQAAVP